MQLTLKFRAVPLGVDEFLLGFLQPLLGDGKRLLLVHRRLRPARRILKQLLLPHRVLAPRDGLMPLANLRLPELLLFPLQPHDRSLDLPLGITQRHIRRLRELPERNAKVLQSFDGINARAGHF